MYKIKKEELERELVAIQNEYLEISDLRNKLVSSSFEDKEDGVSYEELIKLSNDLSDRTMRTWIVMMELILGIDRNTLELLDRLKDLTKGEA